VFPDLNDGQLAWACPACSRAPGDAAIWHKADVTVALMNVRFQGKN
jgi:hypothetical protein